MNITTWQKCKSSWTFFSLFWVLVAFTFCVEKVINAQADMSSVTITGRVVFDTGEPVIGAKIISRFVPLEGSVQAVEKIFLPLIINHEEEAITDADSNVFTSDKSPKVDETITDDSGNFSLTVKPEQPARVVLEVRYDSEFMPTVETAKWVDILGNLLDVGSIVIPNPQGAEMTLEDGVSQNGDSSIQVFGVPTQVNRLFGRIYDPDVNIDVFPGEFAERNQVSLNSSVFLWMEALDANNNSIDSFSNAVRVRARIPLTQWIDLEDISSDTDRIEIPIYTFDEATEMWEQIGIGWLEDNVGTILPEDAESAILSRTYEGEVYSVFETMHFSWMNVDYPYIGPWRLMHLDPDRRNNDCLYAALLLAKHIALSPAGQTAFSKVNQPGASLSEELADGRGPAIHNELLKDSYGLYRYATEDQFYVDNGIWDRCSDDASNEMKKATTLLMAATILHETAHWKENVKKYPDGSEEVAGEEGIQLETDLFGGPITQDSETIMRDGNPVTNEQVDHWLNPDSWNFLSNLFVSSAYAAADDPRLQVGISMTGTTFALGANIPVKVTYTNVATTPLKVMNFITLEGWPITFNIVHQETGKRVPFRGPEYKLALDDTDFTVLMPGQSLNLMTYLVSEPDTGYLQYPLLKNGTYEMTAVYGPLWGSGPSTSNSLNFTLLRGGSLTGTVTSASDGSPLAQATVRILQNENLLAKTRTDNNGSYVIPELPTDTYSIIVSTSGFLSSDQSGIQVKAGQTTAVNFSLSPLLTKGELRAVLTWGETTRDLDSHLWLPENIPYHIYYGNSGDFDRCPFAGLDVDDTDGLGPETITIRQRYISGKYVYAVHNYSISSELKESQAQVQVFDSTGLVGNFRVPTEGVGSWWHVFDLDGQTGSINEVNQLLENSPKPYEVNSGCDSTQLTLPEAAAAEKKKNINLSYLEGLPAKVKE